MKRKRLLCFAALLLLLSLFSMISAKEQDCNIIFEKQDGKMIAAPSDTFLDYTNMLPGEAHSDCLTIDNQTQKNVYKVYMQVCPVEQAAQSDLLLTHTTMQVSYKNKVLYDGNMLGKPLTADGQDLQKLIYLGEFPPEQKETLAVTIRLREDFPASYQEVSGEVHWKFFATLNGTVITPQPDTGDQLPIVAIVSILSVLTLLVFSIVLFKAKRH